LLVVTESQKRTTARVKRNKGGGYKNNLEVNSKRVKNKSTGKGGFLHLPPNLPARNIPRWQTIVRNLTGANENALVDNRNEKKIIKKNQKKKKKKKTKTRREKKNGPGTVGLPGN